MYVCNRGLCASMELHMHACFHTPWTMDCNMHMYTPLFACIGVNDNGKRLSRLKRMCGTYIACCVCMHKGPNMCTFVHVKNSWFFLCLSICKNMCEPFVVHSGELLLIFLSCSWFLVRVENASTIVFSSQQGSVKAYATHGTDQTCIFVPSQRRSGRPL